MSDTRLATGKSADLMSGDSLSGLGSNMSGALRVVDEALGLLMLLQGRVDAFADVTVKSASNSLNGLKGDVEDTLDNLNRVNEDLESLKLAKYQTLASTTLQALAIVR